MAFLRNFGWVVKGAQTFTKKGYLTASKKFNPEDLEVDLTGKFIMITGAHSGVAKVAAVAVAKKGATLYLVCTDQTKGESAQKEIIELTNNQNVHLHIVNYNRPREVCKFADEFLKSEKPLDILINNARCMFNQREYVEEDIEINFATNTLGTHILIKSFLPLISKSSQPRIFIVSHPCIYLQKLNYEDLNNVQMKNYDGMTIFKQNKRQQIVMTEFYATEHKNIFFASMNPGWNDSPAVQSDSPIAREKFSNLLRTIHQAADTLIWMCCYKDLEQFENASYFLDRAPVKKHLRFYNTQNTLEQTVEFMRKLDVLYERISNSKDYTKEKEKEEEDF